MKHLLSVVLLSLLGYTAMAQASSVTVQNNTNCWVYYSIHGANVCNTTLVVSSNIIALAPGGVVNYPNSASIPGFPPGPLLLLNYALIYSGPTGCTELPWRIGEPCTNMFPSYTYRANQPNCSLCATITAQWNSGGPGGNAVLVFF